jgi:hypothetical protein
LNGRVPADVCDAAPERATADNGILRTFVAERALSSPAVSPSQTSPPAVAADVAASSWCRARLFEKSAGKGRSDLRREHKRRLHQETPSETWLSRSDPSEKIRSADPAHSELPRLGR